MDIGTVRQKFPQYKDMSDQELATAIHRKYYSDMPYDEFAGAIGLNQRSLPQELARQGGLAARYVVEGGASIPAMVGNAANAVTNLGISGINAVAGTDIKPLPSVTEAISSTLTTAGLPNPETPLERIVAEPSRAIASIPGFAGAAGATGSKILEPLTQNFGLQAASATTGGGAFGAAKEAFPDNPYVQFALGLAGGLLPGLRGAPRPISAARLENFERAGVSPSLPDVTQSPTLQRAQKVVEAVPLAGNVVRSKEAARLAEAEASSARVAEGYGTPQSPNALGETAQGAVQRYRFGKRPEGMSDRDLLLAPTRDSSITAKADAIYKRIAVKDDAMVTPVKTRESLAAAINKFDDSQLSSLTADGKLSELESIIRGANALSWRDLRRLRTEVRYMRGKTALDPTLDDRALSDLDRALTDDLVAGAREHGGERAVQLMKRADNYYAQSMARIENNLKSVFNAKTPEAAYSQLDNALSGKPGKGDLNKLSSLKRVMTDDEWGDFSATVIDRLGRPTPGTRGAADAPDFSVAQFVTRYGAMSPSARQLLFDGAGRGNLRDALDSLYRATRDMKATDRLANSSNSGNQLIAAGTGGLAVAEPFSAGVGIALSNLTARALYNPTLVRLAAKTYSASDPQARATTATQLIRFAEQNPDYAAEVSDLLKGLVPVRADSTEETTTSRKSRKPPSQPILLGR